MDSSDLIKLMRFAGEKLNFKQIEDKDYVKAAKVFLRFQYLLTKFAASKCYSFMEYAIKLMDDDEQGQYVELLSIQEPPKKHPRIEKPGEYTTSVQQPTQFSSPMEQTKKVSSSVEEMEEKQSATSGLLRTSFELASSPLKTVKSLTKTAVGMPLNVTKYAANLSWDVVSKVSQTLVSKTQTTQENTGCEPSIHNIQTKRKLVRGLLKAKEASGRTFTEIAEHCDITNVYCAQLFHNQAQLKPGPTLERLREAVPELTEKQIEEMCKAPIRGYDPHLVQEPVVSHLNDKVCHYGQSIKALINEECGDGVMSSTDFYMTLDKVTDEQGHDRILITLNGKYEPHIEQKNITVS